MQRSWPESPKLFRVHNCKPSQSSAFISKTQENSGFFQALSSNFPPLQRRSIATFTLCSTMGLTYPCHLSCPHALREPTTCSTTQSGGVYVSSHSQHGATTQPWTGQMWGKGFVIPWVLLALLTDNSLTATVLCTVAGTSHWKHPETREPNHRQNNSEVRQLYLAVYNNHTRGTNVYVTGWCWGESVAGRIAIRPFTEEHSSIS